MADSKPDLSGESFQIKSPEGAKPAAPPVEKSDLEKELATKPEAARQVDQFMRSFASSLTFGGSDKFAGFMRTLTEAGEEGESFRQELSRRIATEERITAGGDEEFPVTSTAGDVAGFVTGPAKIGVKAGTALAKKVGGPKAVQKGLKFLGLAGTETAASVGIAASKGQDLTTAAALGPVGAVAGPVLRTAGRMPGGAVSRARGFTKRLFGNKNFSAVTGGVSKKGQKVIRGQIAEIDKKLARYTSKTPGKKSIENKALHAANKKTLENMLTNSPELGDMLVGSGLGVAMIAYMSKDKQDFERLAKQVGMAVGAAAVAKVSKSGTLGARLIDDALAGTIISQLPDHLKDHGDVILGMLDGMPEENFKLMKGANAPDLSGENFETTAPEAQADAPDLSGETFQITPPAK